MKTGGGEASDLFDLEPLDNKISSIIGNVSIFGQSQTTEPIVNFEGYNCVVIDLKNTTNNEFTSEDSIAFPNNDDQYSLHTPNLTAESTLINNNNADNATNMYGYPEPVTVTNNVTIER